MSPSYATHRHHRPRHPGHRCHVHPRRHLNRLHRCRHPPPSLFLRRHHRHRRHLHHHPRHPRRRRTRPTWRQIRRRPSRHSHRLRLRRLRPTRLRRHRHGSRRHHRSHRHRRHQRAEAASPSLPESLDVLSAVRYSWPESTCGGAGGARTNTKSPPGAGVQAIPTTVQACVRWRCRPRPPEPTLGRRPMWCAGCRERGGAAQGAGGHIESSEVDT
mmetsp:Transcript_28015/g.93135  ORF Transcript_28015/g.93135 Transcript_28015/m.93135 type:complete len:215 (-) Transcript_28015:19-663(-)